MGAVFQSFDAGTASTTGDKWCQGDWHKELAVTDTTGGDMATSKGVGSRGKCSWQVVSAGNTHAPVVEL